MGKKIEFLDLGKNPLANSFLTKKQFKDEYFFNLKYQFDPETFLVSMVDRPNPSKMFNDTYLYDSSVSKTMVDHFKDIAKEFSGHSSILEIGSNSGPFICNTILNNSITNYNFINTDYEANSICSFKRIAVEPCENFAKITEAKGIPTYAEFWTPDLACKIVKEHGFMNVVYSANCISHMENLHDAFFAIKSVLTSDGILVFEEPSLLKVMKDCNYSQFYSEHINVFSVIAIEKILNKIGMYIYKIRELPVHGGSIRIYARKSSEENFNQSVQMYKDREIFMGLDKPETYELFGEQIQNSRDLLIKILNEQKNKGKKIIAYGATSKSATIFNYCNIDDKLISYITDTTPSKQSLYSPGMHIPIVSSEQGLTDDIDVIYVTAWNFINEIREKEIRYKDKTWIIDSPFPRIVK